MSLMLGETARTKTPSSSFENPGVKAAARLAAAVSPSKSVSRRRQGVDVRWTGHTDAMGQQRSRSAANIGFAATPVSSQPPPR
jgi:hypothetical protein